MFDGKNMKRQWFSIGFSQQNLSFFPFHMLQGSSAWLMQHPIGTLQN
jgi:hypothetical protein